LKKGLWVYGGGGGGWGSHEGWRVRRPQESKKDQRSLEGRRRRRRAVELGIELERALDQVDLYSKGWGGSGGWGGLGWVGVSLGEGYVDFDQEWRWGIDFNQVVLVRRPRPGMERVRRPQSGGDEDIDLKVKGLEVELSWVEVGLEMDLTQTSIKGRLGTSTSIRWCWVRRSRSSVEMRTSTSIRWCWVRRP
jgi:hypothetical protein